MTTGQPNLHVEGVFQRQATFNAVTPAYRASAAPVPLALSVNVNVRNETLGGDRYVVSMEVTVEAKPAEGPAAFELKLVMDMVAGFTNIDQAEHPALLTGFLPSQLYPYAREAVSTLVSRSGYPPVVLPLMTFQAPAPAPSESPDARVVH